MARGFQARKRARRLSEPLYMVGPLGVEPSTNGLCLPNMAFATPFGFGVWTVSCLYDLPVQSLHVLLCPGASLGIATPSGRGFPEFEQFYLGAESTYPQATHPESSVPVQALGGFSFKSAALTKHELEARFTASPRTAAGFYTISDRWVGFYSLSRNERRCSDREGWRSLRSALASIWRMRSRVTSNCLPTSSRV